jgi:putative PIN family toxin of toxin-antitoxin system
VKVTPDTSALIAAYVARAGFCAELLEDVLRRHELVLSTHILDEVRRKLTFKFLFPARLVDQVLQSLTSAARKVEAAALPVHACRDPSDILVLGTAVAGDADFLVSVDNDLLDLGQYGTVDIIRPGEFWTRVTR